MKEIIKKWVDDPKNITAEDVAEIICEYCKLFGNRQISGEEIQSLFAINQYIPIQFDMLLKDICIKSGYKIEEVYSTPDRIGNRRLIKRYFYE